MTHGASSGSDGTTFDPDALRQRYAEERERRLRTDGIGQYVEIAGRFAAFGEDPWAEPGFTRAPLTDEVDVAIIGAGFGGLLTGARLRELGVAPAKLPYPDSYFRGWDRAALQC